MSDLSSAKALGDVWTHFLSEKASPAPTPPPKSTDDEVDTVSSLRKSSSMRVAVEQDMPVTIRSTIVKADWESTMPGTNSHIDELNTSLGGVLHQADIIQVLQESHELPEFLEVRYYHPEWAAWGKLPKKVKPAVIGTGELWLEVRARLKDSKTATPVSSPAPQIPNYEKNSTVVVDTPSEASQEDVIVEEFEHIALEPLDKPSPSSVAVINEPEAKKEDPFSSLAGSEVDGSVDNPWLIVERVDEVAVPPLHGETERTIYGARSFKETYRSLLPLALQWFMTRDPHPDSPKIYGAEGDILLSPDKLIQIPGLTAYFDSENHVDRFLLFLAIARDAFTTKGASRVTGKWKPKSDSWQAAEDLPGVLFLDHKWEDEPGLDWNENWNCFLHIVVPESGRDDPAGHCLAAVRFVKAPWKVPPFIKPFQKRSVQTDILAVRPQMLAQSPAAASRRPQGTENGGPRVPSAVPKVPGSVHSWENTTEDVFAQIEQDPPSEYAASVADTEFELPLVTNYPDIEVPRLPNDDVDWENTITRQTLRQILTMLGDIERILNAPEADRNISLVLVSVDKLHPFIRFLKEHRGVKTCEGALVQAQNLLFTGLQIVHKEFMSVLDFSSQPPEADLDLREDILRQLEDIQNGDGRQTLNIPEMPDESSVKTLNALVSRLVVPEWKPRNGISFKDRRGEALVRNLRRLGVQEIRQDQVNQMRWEILEQKMKLWTDQLSISVRILFAAERMLCDRVLLNLDPLADRCFAAVAGDSLRWLVGCGNILAGSRRAPEKLIALLDMYSVVLDLMPAVDEFFQGRAGEAAVRSYKDFVGGLGRIVKDTARSFEQTILHEGAQIETDLKSGKKSGSQGKKAASLGVITPEMSARVKVQPLTSYVVNYLRLLSSENKCYIDTLEHVYSNENMQRPGQEGESGGVPGLFSRIMRALDHNLLAKSKLQSLGDVYLEEVFLLNNMAYVVENVVSCEVGLILGTDWKDRHAEEMKKRRNHFVSLIIHKLDQQVYSLPKGDSRAAATRLKAFNTELDILVKNKSFLLLSDQDLQNYVATEVKRRVLEGYKKFLEIHRDFINTQRSVSKFYVNSVEDVSHKLTSSFQRRITA